MILQRRRTTPTPHSTPNGQHNIVRPHESLKNPCKIHIRWKIWRKYQKRSPVMSAGITDHIWTWKILTFPFIKT